MLLEGEWAPQNDLDFYRGHLLSWVPYYDIDSCKGYLLIGAELGEVRRKGKPISKF